MFKSLWENVIRRSGDDVFENIRGNFLFKNLSTKELHFVTDIVHIRDFKKDEIIFHQKDAGSGMYIISKGRVAITVYDQNTSSDAANEKEALITELVSGDFFGEIALVQQNGIRSATARATEQTRLIGFFKPNLIEIIERRPSAGVKILLKLSEVLGRRLVETTDMVSDLTDQLNALKKSC